MTITCTLSAQSLMAAAKQLREYAQSLDDKAMELFEAMKAEMGKYECYFQPCYDHGLAFYSLETIFKQKKKPVTPIIY